MRVEYLSAKPKRAQDGVKRMLAHSAVEAFALSIADSLEAHHYKVSSFELDSSGSPAVTHRLSEERERTRTREARGEAQYWIRRAGLAVPASPVPSPGTSHLRRSRRPRPV